MPLCVVTAVLNLLPDSGSELLYGFQILFLLCVDRHALLFRRPLYQHDLHHFSYSSHECREALADFQATYCWSSVGLTARDILVCLKRR
jgi:hypothetical protein